MKNFGRILHLSLHYRITVIVSLVCALCVGLLWGVNISAVYPFVKVAFQEKSLQQSLETQIEASVDQVDVLEDQIAALDHRIEEGLTADQTREILIQRDAVEVNLLAEQKALTQYRWIQPYVQRYFPEDPFHTLALLVGLLMLGTIVKGAFVVSHTVLVCRLAQLGSFDLRKVFYRHMLRMDLATFDNEGTADLMSRFTHDMQHVTEGLNVLFGKLVREPLKMAACLILAGLVCWRLLLLSLVIAPLGGLLIRWLAKMLKRANRRAMEEMALLYNTLYETFQGIKIVKAFTMERQERKRFHSNAKEYYKRSMKIARYDALSHPLTELMGMLTICLALLAGAYLVLSGETHLLGIRMSPRPLNLPSLMLFYGLLAGAADPARKLSDVFTRLQRAAAAADRIFAQIDREPQIRDPEIAIPLDRHERDLVFDGVQFAYRPDRPVLIDIDLRLRFGETIAVVGPNGCGKSTLMNLIPRFADPNGGEIRLDGIRLTDVRLSDLRSQIGLVTQEPFLFDDTIRNNIRYGSPHATDEEVVAAAKQAHADRFIESELPDGYETLVGPMGSLLSGGQRQRISLARAILRNPTILLLDEATSQIDLESERIIQQVLERFIRDRTGVIITHRLGVLSLADRILVMHEGRILDSGTHDELLIRCDFYRRLYQIQFDDLREIA